VFLLSDEKYLTSWTPSIMLFSAAGWQNSSI